MKTIEMEGAALDWAVAYIVNGWVWSEAEKEVGAGYSPSTDWSQGGPLIERFEVGLVRPGHPNINQWGADSAKLLHRFAGCRSPMWASTPLIAAMRAIVAAELGDEVEVPAELGEG